MIYIGTDIVQISRINKIIEDQKIRFLSHVFTENEQLICNAKVSPSIHYSGKYAAKEAVKKALLSSNEKKNIPLVDIEIKNQSDGAPIVALKDDIGSTLYLQVSISHTGDYAIATAILEIK